VPPFLLRFVLVAGAIAGTPGRTVTAVATEDVGAPLERAFPSASYARAAAADAEMRWDDARRAYRDAAEAWSAIDRTRPSRALEDAIAKANREAQSSQALLIRGSNSPQTAVHLAEPMRHIILRRQAMEEARLLRSKLMATRAALGRLPAALFTRTRARLVEARDAGDSGHDGGDAEIALALCATEAVGGDAEGARRARATVPTAARSDPVNTLMLAACAAALGENAAALAALESFVLRPTNPRSDAFLRDVYLGNDWDHLRGDPRFESLFR
jgi:hypothetical protein